MNKTPKKPKYILNSVWIANCIPKNKLDFQVMAIDLTDSPDIKSLDDVAEVVLNHVYDNDLAGARVTCAKTKSSFVVAASESDRAHVDEMLSNHPLSG